MPKKQRRSTRLRKQWHTTLVFFTDGQWSAFISRNRRNAHNLATWQNKCDDVEYTQTMPFALTPQTVLDAHAQASNAALAYGNFPWVIDNLRTLKP